MKFKLIPLILITIVCNSCSPQMLKIAGCVCGIATEIIIESNTRNQGINRKARDYYKYNTNYYLNKSFKGDKNIQFYNGF